MRLLSDLDGGGAGRAGAGAFGGSTNVKVDCKSTGVCEVEFVSTSMDDVEFVSKSISEVGRGLRAIDAADDPDLIETTGAASFVVAVLDGTLWLGTASSAVFDVLADF